MPSNRVPPHVRCRRRHYRLLSELEFLLGLVEEAHNSPAWHPLPPRYERRLGSLLHWTWQLTSRVAGTRARVVPATPLSSAQAERLIAAALVDLRLADAGVTASPSARPLRPGTRSPRQLAQAAARRRASVSPQASAEEDSAMWAEYERSEALGIVEE